MRWKLLDYIFLAVLCLAVVVLVRDTAIAGPGNNSCVSPCDQDCHNASTLLFAGTTGTGCINYDQEICDHCGDPNCCLTAADWPSCTGGGYTYQYRTATNYSTCVLKCSLNPGAYASADGSLATWGPWKAGGTGSECEG
jgi:hypothetical protein